MHPPLRGSFLAVLFFTALGSGPSSIPTVAAPATVTSGSVSLYTDDYFDGCLSPRADCLNPYHSKVCSSFKTKAWQAITLENDYLRVVVLPELGGRILRFVNKVTGSNQFYDNPSGIKTTSWGRNQWWMATGGVEVMMPYDEHGGAFYPPFDDHPNPDPGKGYRTARLADGVQLETVFSEAAYFGLVRWRLEVTVYVPDDKAYFRVTRKVKNESGSTRSIQYWQNTMISPGPGNMRHVPGSQANLNQQIVFDQNITQVYNHNDNAGEQFWGNAWDVVQWPVHTGPLHGGGYTSIDVSKVANWYTYGLQYAGLFTRASQPSTYVGQYNLDANEGVAIVIPAQIKAGINTGVKYWHWGSFSGSASGAFADGSTTYCELMTGPVRVFQEPAVCNATNHPTGETYAISMAAGEELVWNETYISPQGIGTFVRASDKSVLNLQAPPNGTIGANVACTLGVYPTAAASGVRVMLSVGSVVFHEIEGLAMAPNAPFFRQINVPLWSALTGSQRIRMTVYLPGGVMDSVEQPISISGTPTTPTPKAPTTTPTRTATPTRTSTPTASPTPHPFAVRWDSAGEPSGIGSIVECSGGFGGLEVATFTSGAAVEGHLALAAAIDFGCSYWVWTFTGLPPSASLQFGLDVNVDCTGKGGWLEIYWRPGAYTAQQGKGVLGPVRAKWSSDAAPYSTGGWQTLTDPSAAAGGDGAFTIGVEFYHWATSPPIIAAYFDNLLVYAPGVSTRTPTPTSLPVGDLDGDGVADALEGWPPTAGQTNRYLPDSDGDGLSDGAEDTNRNGARDPGETYARFQDSDRDGLEDGVEVLLIRTDPLNPTSPPVYTDNDGDGLPATIDLNDGSPDADGDRYGDLYEAVQLGLEAMFSAALKPPLGDVNSDGLVSNVDALAVQALFLGFVDPGQLASSRADANRDGYVTNVDGLGIHAFFLGLAPRMPIGGTSAP